MSPDFSPFYENEPFLFNIWKMEMDHWTGRMGFNPISLFNGRFNKQSKRRAKIWQEWTDLYTGAKQLWNRSHWQIGVR